MSTLFPFSPSTTRGEGKEEGGYNAMPWIQPAGGGRGRFLYVASVSFTDRNLSSSFRQKRRACVIPHVRNRIWMPDARSGSRFQDMPITQSPVFMHLNIHTYIERKTVSRSSCTALCLQHKNVSCCSNIDMFVSI